MNKSKSISLNNQDFIISTGKMARQADGSVLVQHGDSVVIATVVSASNVRENIDFFPLTVDYREKTSAAGKFPGGYIKREARPTEKEILTSRLIDRPIRPLFPKGYYYEVQVMVSVLSADPEIDPDILGVNGASAALMISGIPFAGPIGAVRVGYAKGNYIVNPTITQMAECELEIVVAGSNEGVTMIEGGANEVSEEILAGAVEFAQKHINELISLQHDLKKDFGKPEKEYTVLLPSEELITAIREKVVPGLEQAYSIEAKQERSIQYKQLFKDAIATLSEDFPDATELEINMACKSVQKSFVRAKIINEGKREDGRNSDQIRPITCEVSLLPRTHGSALFTRGETQSLSMATLGTKSDEQRMENLAGEYTKAFMLHYNFPSFSVGEVRPNRGPGRREIGHGMLAERSLSAVIPSKESFPYTIRLISDILESNGSSSMATVCGGTLALMDAGVPIKAPVSGIAMGLIKEADNAVILTDILGSEDACGDMDFKVAGTAKGITGFQLDVKLKEGISMDLLKQGLARALNARLQILNTMTQAIDAPRSILSKHAPKVAVITIPADKIGVVIGPGGRVIKKIIEETGAEINIDDDGRVVISSTSQESIDGAFNQVSGIVKEVEPGEIYDGVVKSVMDFGVFVEVLPGKQGLVHVSELSTTYVKKVQDVASVGDKLRVLAVKIDEKGRLVLSRKRVEEMEAKEQQ